MLREDRGSGLLFSEEVPLLLDRRSFQVARLTALLRLFSQQLAALSALQILSGRWIAPQCQRLEDGMQR